MTAFFLLFFFWFDERLDGPQSAFPQRPLKSRFPFLPCADLFKRHEDSKPPTLSQLFSFPNTKNDTSFFFRISSSMFLCRSFPPLTIHRAIITTTLDCAPRFIQPSRTTPTPPHPYKGRYLLSMFQRTFPFLSRLLLFSGRHGLFYPSE